MKLSCVIIAKNEEKNLARALRSVSFCDETIVIDDNSTDSTVDIARKMGAKLFLRRLDSFAKQRNFGLKKAKGDWILFIDADEVVSEQLKEEITRKTQGKKSIVNGFYLKRKDFIWNKKLKFGETGSIKLLRLARKDSGSWKRKVHEYWKVQGKIEELKNPLLHYPHQNLKQFIFSINYFSSLHARSNLDEGKSSNILKATFYPIFKFIKNYIFRLGFLDGSAGLVHALMMSLHSYLSWGKLCLIQKKS